MFEVAELQPWSLVQLKNSVFSSHMSADTARKLAVRCRRYYHGDQWDEDHLKTLEDREQAPITNNLIERAVNFLMGLEQSRRADPKAYPESERHEAAAEVATDILRSEAQRLDFDRIKSRAFRDMLIENACGVQCIVRPSEDGQRYENHLIRIEPEDLIYDPMSRELDFSDAGFIGVGRFYNLDYALATFGQTEEQRNMITQSKNLGSGEMGSHHDHRQERKFRWFDSIDSRVYISQVYYQLGGEWIEATFCAGGILSEQWSPYRTQSGKTRCPIVARSLYIDLEGNRHGRVKSMLSPQDEINQRLSRMLFLLSAKQIFYDRGSGFDPEVLRREIHRPTGVIPTDGPPGESVQVVQHFQDIQHHSILLQEAKGFINLQGPNAALQGRGVESQSGRAIQAQQQAGLMEESEPFDNIRDWALDVYRALWMNCRQFMSEERTILITEREDAYEFVKLNQEVVNEFGEVVQVINRVAEMDVAIRVSTGRDAVTLMTEQREQLIQVLQIYGPQVIPPEVALKFFELSQEVRKEIEDALTGGDDPEAQQRRAIAQQLQEMMRRFEVQKAELENQKTGAEVQDTLAEMEKTIAETQEIRARLNGLHPQQMIDAAKVGRSNRAAA